MLINKIGLSLFGLFMDEKRKKNIVFLMSRFLDGGIDTVLVEYLRYLAKDERYQITLAIATYMDKLEVFRNRIPKNVKVIYFNRMKLLTRVPQKRITKQAGKITKLYGEIMNPILRRKTQHNIHKLAKTTDLFIDFDCCAYSFLKSVHTKKIAFFHFSFAQSMAQNPKRMKRIRKQLEKYDSVITISKAMKDEGCKMFPELKDKLFVIYNAKDQESIRRNAEIPVADERIKEPYFLAVERLEESQKDITTLLKAYALLRKEKGVKEKLYIIGKGNSEELLRQLTVDLDIDKDVEFLGFISNPYPWIKNSKLLLHSAKFEGLPTVLVEGLLLGKLMVSSDCPTGPKEIFNYGKAGVLVPVGDARAFADATYQLLTDSALQQQILQGVTERAFDFTFPAIDKKISELL